MGFHLNQHGKVVVEGQSVGPGGPLQGAGKVSTLLGHSTELAICPGNAPHIADFLECFQGPLVPPFRVIKTALLVEQDAQLAAFMNSTAICSSLPNRLQWKSRGPGRALLCSRGPTSGNERS